jgi:iron complex outermembrane recepter protein
MSTPHLPYSIVAFSILQAFAASAHGQSAEPGIPEVVITGSKAGAAAKASIGGFSDAPMLQTPASISVLTRAQMQDLAIRNTSDAMKFDASVGDAYNAVGYAEQFSIRGFALNNSSSYRKDGLAIPGDTQIPLENKERIEVLKGLAGFQAGVAAPGGIVNYVTKRPTAAPLRSVTVEASERGTLYGAVDLGGRFDDQRIGYRINAAAEKLRSYIKGANGERQFLSAAFDWQLTPQALLQLDVDYQHKAQISAPGFQLTNGTDLPTGITADTMLNAQPWSRPVDTATGNIGLRFEYQFNPNWSTAWSANYHSFKRDDYTAFPFGCFPTLPGAGYCANGDFDVYDYQSVGESKAPLAAQALLQGKFTTGALKHELTAGVSSFQRRDKFGDFVFAPVGTSNIFRPVNVDPAPGSTGPVFLRRTENERAVFVQDILALSDNVKLHAGLRYVNIKLDQFVAADQPHAASEHRFVLPNVALVYNPRDNVAVYGAYAQGAEHGGIAPIGTDNQNTALDPAKSRQFEVGVKADLARDLSVAASLFEIRKGLEYTDATNNTFVRNGEARHRGLELSVQGKLTPDLVLGISAAALHAQQQGTGRADLDGKRVTNVPRFKASAYLDYAVAQLPGLKLNGTWRYAGRKAFDPANTVIVPGYHVFDLGASYASKIAGTPAILRASVNNAFNKFYWRDVTQELGGYLFPGAPRTFKVSAQFDF